MLKPHELICWGCLFIAPSLHAQLINLTPANAGMGGAGLAISQPYSLIHNPSAIAFAEARVNAVVTHQQTLGLVSINTNLFAFAYRFKNVTAGAGVSSSGFSLFNKRAVHLMLVLSVQPDLSVGTILKTTQTRFGDIYGSMVFSEFSLSVTYKLNENVMLACRTYNPPVFLKSPARFFRTGTFVTAGLSRKFSEKLTVAADLIFLATARPAFRTGITYNYQKQLVFRCGLNSLPFTPTFGLGLLLHGFRLDIAAGWHLHPGWSPYTGITYESI